MFKYLLAKDMIKLGELAPQFTEHRRPYASLMCLDTLISLAPLLQGSTQSQISARLISFEQYVQLIKGIVIHKDPCHNGFVQKLFAFYGSSEEGFCISHGSFLHSYISHSDRIVPLRSDDHGDWISPVDLNTSLRQSLSSHLRTSSDRLSDALLKVSVLSPCLNFAVNRQCNRENCNWHHVEPRQVHEYYGFRVRAHVQCIAIMQEAGTERHGTSIRDQR
jgi:hypothetical protein